MKHGERKWKISCTHFLDKCKQLRSTAYALLCYTFCLNLKVSPFFLFVPLPPSLHPSLTTCTFFTSFRYSTPLLLLSPAPTPFFLRLSFPPSLSIPAFPSFLPSSLRCICPLLVYLPALTHSVTESSSSPSSSIVYFWMPISSLLSTLPYFLSPATAYLLPLCSQMKPSSSLCITRAYT